MHKIIYRNSESNWDEALPIGNGHFGAMAYNPGNKLIFTINHYDVYYRKLSWYSRENEGKIFADNSKYQRPYTLKDIEQRAFKFKDKANYNYVDVLNPKRPEEYGVIRKGVVNPISGQLEFYFKDERRIFEYKELFLNIEEAKINYKVKSENQDLNIQTIILQEPDIIISSLKGKLLVDKIILRIPEIRNFENTRKSFILDESTSYIEGNFYGDDEDKEKHPPFRYLIMVKLIDVTGKANKTEFDVEIKIDSQKTNNWTVLTTVVTEYEGKGLVDLAKGRLENAEKQIEVLKEKHKKYWSIFWNKSKINLPDKMLEDLWYLHLYSLECSSGKGAHLYEQACGLNGLWDIEPPTQWGSTFYWDINIEEAFWPIYTANHLEIGESFYKALEAYIPAAKKRAKTFFNINGIASDYPFDFYFSMWAWCAQYFWWQYKYSQDRKFLRKRAYPLFKDILAFFDDYLKYNEKLGIHYIFPDVSPEQGPMTKNSTITLSCLKFLLKAAIKANETLNEDKNDKIRWQNILNKFPVYATGETIEFGKTIKDSEWAAPDLELGHPSLLMPIYPIGEISKRDKDERRKIATNTLKYAEKMLHISTHNFGWLACTAARLGFGNTAKRAIYERGISLMMRINGMFTEETERWIQNCLVNCKPVYNPPLIEGGSSLVAAINEMLLQSFNEVIEVFPALPSDWKEVSFESLLAEGDFEVSAKCSDHKVISIRIKSLTGNTVNIINPFPDNNCLVLCEGKKINFSIFNNIISFKTEKGKSYKLEARSYLQRKNENKDVFLDTNYPRVYYAPTRRRVFLGKDENTDYLRALDDFTLDYHAGDQQVSKICVYKFDFSLEKEKLFKDYESVLPKQYHGNGKIGPDFIRITNKTKYFNIFGYGWEKINGLRYIDRKDPDEIRRDFIASQTSNVFLVYLNKGAYNLLFVSGDSEDENTTMIEVNTLVTRAKIEAVTSFEKFMVTTVPIKKVADGLLEIEFSSQSDIPWKINALIINKII